MTFAIILAIFAGLTLNVCLVWLFASRYEYARGVRVGFRAGRKAMCHREFFRGLRCGRDEVRAVRQQESANT